MSRRKGKRNAMNKKLQQDMKDCRLCPRNCGVNRLEQTGVCGQTASLKVARAALHMWEETCISGKNGSGAVFFSGCALHCVFCQNKNIANGTAGIEISTGRLSEIFLELQEQKANNINLVTPGQFVPQIIQALDRAKRQGLSIPVVYNTSSYETVDTIRRLEGYVDIYLPDLKYVDERRSKTYSHAADYFTCASRAIAEMVRQTGEACFAPEQSIMQENWKEQQMTAEEYQTYSEAHAGDGIMVKGTIVRHLLMPEGLADSKRVVDYLLTTYGSQIFISLMNQYTPCNSLETYPELMRTVTGEEYEELIDYAIAQGIENGFIQEGETAKESFIPEFDGEGVV